MDNMLHDIHRGTTHAHIIICNNLGTMETDVMVVAVHYHGGCALSSD